MQSKFSLSLCYNNAKIFDIAQLCPQTRKTGTVKFHCRAIPAAGMLRCIDLFFDAFDRPNVLKLKSLATRVAQRKRGQTEQMC